MYSAIRYGARFCSILLIVFAGFFIQLSTSTASPDESAANTYRLQDNDGRYQLNPEVTQSTQAVGPEYPIQSTMQRLEEEKIRRAQSAEDNTDSDAYPYMNTAPTVKENLLPTDVRRHLAKAGIPLSSIGVYVQEITPTRTPILAINADQPMNPASTMKLVTTYAAMEIMGQHYQWTTSVYRDGAIIGDTLQGNLIFKGTGDPGLGIEELRLIVTKLRETGLRKITGDLILDRTHFNIHESEYRPFDGDPDKPGNVPPDPLMLERRVFFAKLTPDPVAQQIDIQLTPDLKSVETISNIRYDKKRGKCRKQITKQLEQKPDGTYRLTFDGSMSMDCPDTTFRFASVDMPNYFGGAFASVWQEMGGQFNGRIINTILPQSAVLLATYYSPPLLDALSITNKRSNNMFAKQLFLSLGTVRYNSTGSQAHSTSTVQEWLQAKGLVFPEMLIENGSGLSRIERISAKNLGLLLENAAYSPVFNTFLNSLPLVGVDGTMARRLRNREVTGNASIKTGTLRDVKCIAGYVRSLSKRDYIVVFFINHPNAGSSHGVQALDQLIEWVYFDAPQGNTQPI